MSKKKAVGVSKFRLRVKSIMAQNSLEKNKSPTRIITLPNST